MKIKRTTSAGLWLIIAALCLTGADCPGDEVEAVQDECCVDISFDDDYDVNPFKVRVCNDCGGTAMSVGLPDDDIPDVRDILFDGANLVSLYEHGLLDGAELEAELETLIVEKPLPDCIKNSTLQALPSLVTEIADTENASAAMEELATDGLFALPTARKPNRLSRK